MSENNPEIIIEPLTWSKQTFLRQPDEYYTESVYAYRIIKIYRARPIVFRLKRMGYEEYSDDFDTLEEAQQYAQNDHEKRMRCLIDKYVRFVVK